MAQKWQLGNTLTGSISRTEPLPVNANSSEVNIDIHSEDSARIAVPLNYLTPAERNDWHGTFHEIEKFCVLSDDSFDWDSPAAVLFAGFVNKLSPKIRPYVVELDLFGFAELAKARIVGERWNSVTTDPTTSVTFTASTPQGLLNAAVKRMFDNSTIPADYPKNPVILGTVGESSGTGYTKTVLVSDVKSYFDLFNEIAAEYGIEWRFVPRWASAARDKIVVDFITGSAGAPHINEDRTINLVLDENTTRFSSWDVLIDSNDFYSGLYVQSKPGSERTGADLTQKAVTASEFPILVERFFDPGVELTPEQMTAQINARLAFATQSKYTAGFSVELQQSPATWAVRIGYTLNIEGLPDTLSAGHDAELRCVGFSSVTGKGTVVIDVMRKQPTYPRLPRKAIADNLSGKTPGGPVNNPLPKFGSGLYQYTANLIAPDTIQISTTDSRVTHFAPHSSQIEDDGLYKFNGTDVKSYTYKYHSGNFDSEWVDITFYIGSDFSRKEVQKKRVVIVDSFAGGGERYQYNAVQVGADSIQVTTTDSRVTHAAFTSGDSFDMGYFEMSGTTSKSLLWKNSAGAFSQEFIDVTFGNLDVDPREEITTKRVVITQGLGGGGGGGGGEAYQYNATQVGSDSIQATTTNSLATHVAFSSGDSFDMGFFAMSGTSSKSLLWKNPTGAFETEFVDVTFANLNVDPREEFSTKRVVITAGLGGDEPGDDWMSDGVFNPDDLWGSEGRDPFDINPKDKNFTTFEDKKETTYDFTSWQGDSIVDPYTMFAHEGNRIYGLTNISFGYGTRIQNGSTDHDNGGFDISTGKPLAPPADILIKKTHLNKDGTIGGVETAGTFPISKLLADCLPDYIDNSENYKPPYGQNETGEFYRGGWHLNAWYVNNRIYIGVGYTLWSGRRQDWQVGSKMYFADTENYFSIGINGRTGMTEGAWRTENLIFLNHVLSHPKYIHRYGKVVVFGHGARFYGRDPILNRDINDWYSKEKTNDVNGYITHWPMGNTEAAWPPIAKTDGIFYYQYGYNFQSYSRSSGHSVRDFANASDYPKPFRELDANNMSGVTTTHKYGITLRDAATLNGFLVAESSEKSAVRYMKAQPTYIEPNQVWEDVPTGAQTTSGYGAQFAVSSGNVFVRAGSNAWIFKIDVNGPVLTGGSQITDPAHAKFGWDSSSTDDYGFLDVRNHLSALSQYGNDYMRQSRFFSYGERIFCIAITQPTPGTQRLTVQSMKFKE